MTVSAAGIGPGIRASTKRQLSIQADLPEKGAPQHSGKIVSVLLIPNSVTPLY
jgi:hypothetical protein